LEDNAVMRLTTALTTSALLLFPYWPRDIVPLSAKQPADGEVYVKQVGTRSGQLFFHQEKAGSVFYLQNLSALADYNQQTKTSAGKTWAGNGRRSALLYRRPSKINRSKQVRPIS
jgi:hypothetical protein